MQNYKELHVWAKAHTLTLEIYEITKSYPKEELYSLTSQLRRATSSIAANIAEGCGKFAPLEFAHFLNIALGSANEVDYFLLLSKDLKYLPEDRYMVFSNSINQIKAMLISLIIKVRNEAKKSK